MAYILEDNENFIHNRYGYCYYAINSNNTAFLFNLYVEPGYGKQGHATHLILLVLHEINSQIGTAEIRISADPRENSISKEDLIYFYRKIGLKVI